MLNSVKSTTVNEGAKPQDPGRRPGSLGLVSATAQKENGGAVKTLTTAVMTTTMMIVSVIKILIIYKFPSFENIRLSNLLFKFLIQDKWKFPIYNELIIFFRKGG